MVDKNYEAKSLTLYFTSEGDVKIRSDGLTENKACTQREIKSILSDLERSGWSLISYQMHKFEAGTDKAIDLYFRREIP